MERTEHPKPQFERENWLNLNGEWEFEFDFGNSGEERGQYREDAVFHQKINVPFCPESVLSGIGYTDFMTSVWYRRKINLKKELLSQRIFLHFGAVDHFATVYINGQKCGTHKGGYVSFKVDVSPYVREGENIITVHAVDDIRDRLVARGKQAETYYSEQCVYTRTTGIWQTVWLEFVPKTYIEKVKYYPDIQSGMLTIVAETKGRGEFFAESFFDGRETGSARVFSEGGTTVASIPLKEKHLWRVGEGGLYTLYLHYGEDKVKSYFGLRNIRLDGYRFLINETSVFQRLVLDQGFYPDGIYTAPNDKALLADIERSIRKRDLYGKNQQLRYVGSRRMAQRSGLSVEYPRLGRKGFRLERSSRRPLLRNVRKPFLFEQRAFLAAGGGRGLLRGDGKRRRADFRRGRSLRCGNRVDESGKE